MRFATAAIHVGQEPDPATGATIPPICVSSTFTQDEPGRHRGYEYSRTDNPTRRNYERCLAALDGGEDAAAFASGSAATCAVLAAWTRPGQRVVAYSDLYGGTYRLFEQVFRPWGLDVRYVERRDPAAFAGAVDESTRLVWLETPTNPRLHVLDIHAVTQAVRACNADCLVVVDNTFATPALQRPLELGADLVVYSTTKYIGGHSDLVGGAVVARFADRLVPVRFYQNAAGAVPSPWDCFLAQRGLKTLALRMHGHCANAQRVAAWASSQPAFSEVLYPGLPTHPDHEVAQRQMHGFGGMVSCVLRDGLDAARRFVSHTRYFACAESLGGVESLICHPASMTHASIPAQVRARHGLSDGLVRLSVGLEDVDDLIADLEQALMFAGEG
jgi:cystathionine gamma-lyase